MLLFISHAITVGSIQICILKDTVWCKTKEMDSEQDTPGSNKLLRWPLRKNKKHTHKSKLVNKICKRAQWSAKAESEAQEKRH